jgi:hypothetical protein
MREEAVAHLDSRCWTGRHPEVVANDENEQLSGLAEWGSTHGLFFDSRCSLEDCPSPVKHEEKYKDGQLGNHENPTHLLFATVTSL